MKKQREHIVIIGNGISGITAARHIRKFSPKRITVISSESEYFFARTALMYVFMGHLRWKDILPYENDFWENNNIELLNEHVEKLNPASKLLYFQSGRKLNYDKLILATGAIPRKLGCEGENLEGVQTFVSKQDLEHLEKNTKNCRRAVIIGGGLIGVELAEMLKTRKIKVSMIIRENAFWGNVLPQQDAEFISRHIRSHGINLLFNSELEKINTTEEEKVTSVSTKDGREIECDLVCFSVGVKPNIGFLRNSGIETDLGILVDRKLQTNCKDVFAVGDCVQQRTPVGNRDKTETIWYTARMMGETVAQTICGNPKEYLPGNWFNSAKFFEIEYQTYGRVWPTKQKDIHQLHWESENKKKAITIAFNIENKLFLGINTFGIRMRHAIFDKWLSEERSVQYVLQHLKTANFDPEFYQTHEKAIFSSFKNSL